MITMCTHEDVHATLVLRLRHQCGQQVQAALQYQLNICDTARICQNPCLRQNIAGHYLLVHLYPQANEDNWFVPQEAGSRLSQNATLLVL